MANNRAETARQASAGGNRPYPPPPRPPRAYTALCTLALAAIYLAGADKTDKLDYARATIRLKRAAGRYVRCLEAPVK